MPHKDIYKELTVIMWQTLFPFHNLMNGVKQEHRMELFREFSDRAINRILELFGYEDVRG